MLTQTTITWPAVDWPTSTIPATQYAVFINGQSPLSQTVGSNSALVSYEDSLVTLFVIRPTDGTNYGPYQTVVLGNGQSATRAWIRDFIRKRVGDRIDTGATTLKFADDTLNEYINQAVRDYSLRFPIERDITITLVEGGFMTGARDYQLPVDFRRAVRVRYSNASQLLQLELCYKPFKGGESTAGTMIGYPKLGILVPPSTGRFYGGNYDLFEGAIHLDFDPKGNGDTLYIRYKATIPDLTDDIAPIPIRNEDMELITLFAETKTWEQLEGNDVSLSRWRGKEDGGRRDDLPTEKMSARMRKLYDQKIAERLTLMPQVKRLVRR